MQTTPLLYTENLCKHVTNGNAQLTLLDNINLSIKKGTSVAITGASGSGKSTLLSLLAGLDIPSTGKVQLFGEALEEFDEDQRAQLRAGRVGFVFQAFQLMQGLTALENVCTPLELDADEQQIRAKATAALEQVGVAHRSHHFPTQLSGGEQQRVALARAFVTQPDVLFADEPTGNLDQQTGHQIIDLLFSLQHEQQTTLVLVTHDEELANQCDVKLHLDSGKLVA